MRSLIMLSILVLVLGVTGYVYWYYYNPYSDGYREGVLQKFSRKGNLFKTHEGEIIQLGFGPRSGYMNAQYFYFSVDNNKIADSLERSIGKIVKVHYTQYRRSLPWRGESYDKANAEKGQYVVDGIADVRANTY
jgi:uncharacterized protein YpmB